MVYLDVADCTAGGKYDGRRLQHAFAAWRARDSGSRRYRVLLQWCALEKGGREVLLQWMMGGRMVVDLCCSGDVYKNGEGARMLRKEV